MINYDVAAVITLVINAVNISGIVGEKLTPDALQGLMFLDLTQFTTYRLIPYHPMHIGPFLLLIVLILYDSIREVTENASFFQMILYRSSKKRVLIQQMGSIGKIIGKKILYINGVVLIVTGIISSKGDVAHFISTIGLLEINLMKYGTILYILLLIHEYLAVHRDRSSGLWIILSAMMGIVLVDVLAGTHIITFNSIVSQSIIALGINTVVIVGLCIGLYRQEKKRSEY